MPPQIAWSYWREEAALIIERVIYCPGSPRCSGSHPFAARFPVLSLSREARTQNTKVMPSKKREGKTSLPAISVPLSHPTAWHRGAGAAAAVGIGLGKGRLGFARGVPPLARVQRLRREEGMGGEGSPTARTSPGCGQPAPVPRLGITAGEQRFEGPLRYRFGGE